MKLIHGDCLEEMKKLEDKSIDIIFTDPPYGVSFKKTGEPYMVGDTVNLLPSVMPEFRRILKDDGAIYLWSATTMLQQNLTLFMTYFKLHNIVIWDKINGVYPHSNAHYKLQYEPILYGSKGLHYLDKVKCGDVISVKKPLGKKRVHPTQKPFEVIEELLIPIINKSKKIVLDPFMGSGTVGVACKKLGLSFIGIELEKEYIDIAKARINHA